MDESSSTRKFGTFLGVYTPSILTILGLIMYLRFGWVVANLGLTLTLLSVLMASSITFVTGLSASAIATNMKVGVGGEYFMISRSLGLEPGGAIGIPLYLCRTLSITFYAFGLAEAIVLLWPGAPSYAIPALAAGVIVLITILSGKSAEWVLKLQIPIMIIVGLSILALAIGVLSNDFRAPEMTPSYRSAPEGFWYVFAVFFPAVTGFTAGVGMSGDLKEPRKSIPLGTLAAVISGAVIYLTIPFLLSITAGVPMELLAEPESGILVWTSIALLGGIFIYPAVWGAILSSAFGSILGGPRVLQALSMDGLAPKSLSRLSKSGQPTIATWVSGGIALLAVGLGALNTVAQLVTVLFLTLYVAINLSSVIESLVGDPSYRPQIRVHWIVSLFGAIGAIVVMFLISPWACLIAVALEFTLYVYLRRRELKKEWGDVQSGIWLVLARFALEKHRARTRRPRNWRPQMLLFVGDVEKRIKLIRVAHWFGKKHGILTAAHLEIGQLEDSEEDLNAKTIWMEKILEKNALQAFAEVHVVANFERGVMNISQAHGIAGFKTNTILMGWSDKPEGQVSLLRILRGVTKAGKNVIFARRGPYIMPSLDKRVDIWWGGRKANGNLMLLLAYLLGLNTEWMDPKITIRSVVDSEEEKVQLQQSIEQLLPLARIKADLEVLVRSQGQPIEQIVQQYSRDADIVFLGLMVPKSGDESAYAERLHKLSENLKLTVFVHNANTPNSVPVLLQLQETEDITD